MVFNKIKNYFTILKEISFLGIAHFIPTIIAAGFWFYIASLIGDEAYGELTYYLTIAGIGSTITLLGTPTALNVYAAKGERILPVISMITFTTSAIGAITVFFIFHNPGISLHIFTYVIFMLISAEFLGRKLFKTYMKIMIIQKLLMASLAIICYHLIGNDGIIIGIAFSFIPFITLYYKEFKNYKIDFKSLRSKKKFIFNNYLLDFSRMFSGSMDKIIIAPIFGFAILGNYALGMQFYMMFLLIPSIIFQYIVPQDASGNPNILLKKITVLVSVIIAILALIFSPMIIKIMFPTFIEAVSIVQIIALAVIPGTIKYMYISKFLGNLKNKIILFSSIIFLTSISLGMIVFGQLYDVQGIAAAFVLANTMEAIFLLIADKFYNIKKDKIG
jgi:O-antigen/teichoic acid export membrane protein